MTPAFITEIMSPANRPRLWLGIWSGFAIAGCFGVLAIALAILDLTPWRWIYLGLVSVKLLTNSVAWLALSRDRLVSETQGINTIADILLITAAIYFTGGPYSPMLSAYVIEIAVLSLLSNLGVTILMAAVSVVAFSAMLLGIATGLIPPQPVPGAPGQVPTPGFVATSILLCALIVGIPAGFSAATLRLLKTKQRDLEQRTKQMIDAATQRSQFIASMTHELRTPIHGVQGLSDVIAAGVYGPVTDKQKEACASIKRSAQNLLGLVDDVLNFARAEAGRIEARPGPTDIGALVDRATASVSWMVGTKKLALDTEVEPDLPIVQSDDRWLAHVIVNLIGNAVKFTPEGGNVTVRAYLRDEADSVILEVADTGIGISDAERAEIFEPFRQGDSSDEKGYGGVGLGLALVAKLTSLLGCEVELESQVGRGSTFRIVVPVEWHGRASATASMKTVNLPIG